MMASQIVPTPSQPEHSVEFTIQSITCGHCINAVTEALHSVDPRAVVEVDLDTHRVKVETTESRAALTAALIDADYPPD